MKSNLVIIAFCCLIALLVLVFAVSVITKYSNFNRELRRLNMEINRTHGREKEHYIRRKRKLWRSLIPFVKYR